MSHSPPASAPALAPSRERNGQSDTSTASERGGMPKEKMGIMSTTLTPSPVVRWILPARIRSRRHNDVVFVGSTYIQLREFHQTGQLSDTTAKLDFGSQILGAKVISAKVQMVQTLDAILDQEWDEERFIIKGESCTDDQPPQIVVLVTATGDLVYVYAKGSADGKQVELVFAKRALLPNASVTDRHLRHMAIDPECKILATASYSTCTVFSLREVDDLKDSIDAWDPHVPNSFQPNLEQRMFQVDGHILKMDFLRATEAEPHKAVLLFVVVNCGQTLLLMYTWDTREPLAQLRPASGVVQALPYEDRFPLLLIPSKKHASLAIVTETSVVFYDNVRSSNTRRLCLPLDFEQETKQKLFWVQWAKPSRHDGYSNQKEDILLLREDGRLRMFTRPHNPPTIMATNFSPGKVNIGVDSAVCMLPGPRHMGGDILIVGGSMIDGGLFHLPPRQELYMLQVIPNVSPVHKMAVVDSRMAKDKDARARRTFVTAGVPEISSLNELRFGLEAQVGWTVPLVGGETVNRIWALEHADLNMLFILVSHLEQTTAIALDLQDYHLEEIDPRRCPGLQLDDRTLAVGMFTSGIGIQITSRYIVAGVLTETPRVERIKDCVCADVNDNEESFAVACKTGMEYTIRVGLVNEVDDQPSILLSHDLHITKERPLCLALFRLVQGQCLVVGYSDGHIEIFSIGSEGQLNHGYSIPADETSPIASIIVLSHSQNSHGLVLAGTRDGKLKAFELVARGMEPDVRFACQLDRVFTIGRTPITIFDQRRLRSNGSLAALVTCEERLDQITYFKNDACSDYMLSSIWLSTRNNLAYNQPLLTAAQRIHTLKSFDSNSPGDFLICATNDDILFARMIEQEQIVPRRLVLSGKGVRHMIFSKSLEKFVIASDPVHNYETSVARAVTPQTSSALHFIDPDRVVGRDQEIKIILGEHEQVKALIHCEPTDGSNHFNLIMAGLYDQTNSRLGHISTKRFRSDPGAAVFKQFFRLSRKEIHALCAFDRQSLIVSANNELIIMYLDFQRKAWTEEARYTLPSPAVSVAAQGSTIYAATSLHSVLVLNWRRSERQFEIVATDSQARNTRSLIPFGENGDRLLVTFASDHGSSIIAFSLRHINARKELPAPLFLAEIPLGIDHLALIPSSWSSQPQTAFQGIAFDGTIFTFQILVSAELKLLRFIEQLAAPDPAKSAKKTAALFTEDFRRKLAAANGRENTPIYEPRRMHVRGDIVKRVVEGGPAHLRSLLRARVKNEDDMIVDGASSSAMTKLETLARPLVGETSDLPGAVIAWCRRILRATIY